MTNIPDFREFLISNSYEAYNAAVAANPLISRPVLVNALHFMQEVELVHSAEVDHAQLDIQSFDEEELMEFGESNRKRGELINYVWEQIKLGNETIIDSVCQLELEQANKFGISNLAETHLNDLGRPGARLYSLEELVSLSVPDSLPEDI